MRELQYLKQVQSIPPISSSGAFTVVNVVDTAGYDDMLVMYDFGTMAADLSVAKLTESDVSASGYVDTTNGALADLTAATNAEGTAYQYVNLRGHGRYFKPSVTAGGATLMGVKFILYNPNGVLPKNAATRNVTQYQYIGSIAQ